MTGCWALNCTSSHAKGDKLVHFPTNLERRKIWIQQVGRYDAFPTTSACLCENHFAPEMWEKPRVDGKKKLKFNAVPTIFESAAGHPSGGGLIDMGNRDMQNEDFMYSCFDETSTLLVVNPMEETETYHFTPESLEAVDGSSTNVNDISTEDGLVKMENENEELHNEQTYDPITSVQDYMLTCSVVNLSDAEEKETVGDLLSIYWEKKYKDLKRKYENISKRLTQAEKDYVYAKIALSKINQRYIHERNLSNRLKIENKKLKAKIVPDGIICNEVGEDQIQALKGTSKRPQKWSKETLKKALELKVTWGTAGYDALRKKNVPLPSRRTLAQSLAY